MPRSTRSGNPHSGGNMRGYAEAASKGKVAYAMLLIARHSTVPAEAAKPSALRLRVHMHIRIPSAVGRLDYVA